LSDAQINPAFHPTGPDAALSWHAWAALKPSPAVAVFPRR
jgi:hypothetical protein